MEKNYNTEEFTFQLEKDINVKLAYTYRLAFEEELNIVSKETSLSHKFSFYTDFKDDLILHWGISYKGKEWTAPSADIYPDESKVFDNKAVQTKFVKDLEHDSLKSVNINLNVTQQNLIKSLNFVFNIPGKNKWYNNDNKDYIIPLKTTKNKKKSDLEVPDFVREIIQCETENGSWTLMHRYNKCLDILNNIDLKDSESLIWIFLWLRFSYVRLLDWQRNYNTKPRELSYSMSRLTGELTNKFGALLSEKYKSQEEIHFRSEVLLKMCLSMLGKGTGEGQKIRDEILQIMHKHHIKETSDHFYEQWHQKLHNNTTPDDVVICEAVLAYLKSGGQMDVYWKTLNQGGVTKERLANFERKIVCEPHYMPQLIKDLENFLYTLKAVHSSNDLNIMFESAKYILQNSGEFYKFEEIIRNKYDWDSLKQIYRVTEGRETLNKLIFGNLKDSNRLRDLLFYDICLESYLRQIVEKIIHINLEFVHYVSEISAILKNLAVSFGIYEIRLCLDDWINVAENLKSNITQNNNQTIDSSLKIKSVSDRLSRILTHIIDYFNEHFDPKSKYLGTEFNADKYMVNIFTEEIIRGTLFFTLSMILKKIEPILRKSANLGAWLIISRGVSNDLFKGYLNYSKTLQEVQMKTYDRPTVLLTEQVGGNEEIPPNVVCLIIIKSRDYPDVLAHVSVRARNLGVPFMVCFDDELSCNLLKNLIENKVSIKIKSQNVEIVEHMDHGSTDSLVTLGLSHENQKIMENHKKSLYLSDGFPSIYLELEEFSKDYLGAKSNNTKLIFKKLPDWVSYPESFAIPFNVFEYFLGLEDNSSIKEKLEIFSKNLQNCKNNEVSEILSNCRKIIHDLKFVLNDQTARLRERMITFGINEKEFPNAWKSIKGVWASKYNERAYISTRKVGIQLEDIRMAVLAQKIIPADYSYVIHTKNPSTNDENEVYAEVVLGMGETLVGTYAGQSFSFTYNKSNLIFINFPYKETGQHKIQSYPNKSVVLKNRGFIFRSDSNTEDLEGFAGAGLFDSIPISDHEIVHMSYHKNELFTNETFAKNLIKKIAQLGIEVENIFNYPQDIEGVLYQNQYYIVQTRPQV